MVVRFGDFSSLCKNVPSYPWCNFFYRQISHTSPNSPLILSPENAGVGIQAKCSIPRLHAVVNGSKSLGNIANVVLCGVSMLVVLALLSAAWRRRAAVARIEMFYFLTLYFISLPLQLLTTSSFLAQGSTALVVLTAIHAGVVATLFWTLLGNAFVSMQVVEDGTLSSLIPFTFLTLAFFAVTTYISLDVALTITNTFGPSQPLEALHSTPLFVLTSIWPGAAALLYFVTMGWVVVGMLREVRPLWFYILAATLFVLSQLDFFLLNKVICNGTNQKIDGAFIATLLETLSVVVLFMGWRSITEDTWEEEVYYAS